MYEHLTLRDITKIGIGNGIVIVQPKPCCVTNYRMRHVMHRNAAVFGWLARQVELIAPKVGVARIRLAIRNFTISR